MKCPDCGNENRIGVLLCGKCGADLYEVLLERVATKQLSRFQTREFLASGGAAPSSNPMVAYVSGYESPLAIERRANLVLGRGTREADGVDIDLSDYGAQDLGVSRRHARFDAHTHAPTITDIDSTNGVFVNESRIPANQAFAVRSGDEIKLGRMVMRLYFK